MVTKPDKEAIQERRQEFAEMLSWESQTRQRALTAGERRQLGEFLSRYADRRHLDMHGDRHISISDLHNAFVSGRWADGTVIGEADMHSLRTTIRHFIRLAHERNDHGIDTTISPADIEQLLSAT